MKKIIFATNNVHKLKEVRQIFQDKYQVLSLKDIGFDEDIPETGKTIQENASIKSWFIFNRFGLNCFSDDTGLEIDALEGRPGVYSARYAGEEGNPEKNIIKVLAELQGVENRTARFKTVVSLILDGIEYKFEGSVEGRIITEKKGLRGFGYDPVFIPSGYDLTFAEMPEELKNLISHRAMAVQKLSSFFKHRKE
ncbi:MAG TPA: non-canonical purine NTP diphosphatase [Bacteroidetes bacterium]|nr:non-canonical purine NTP diphosphatase [Bacteroidota bacterium]